MAGLSPASRAYNLDLSGTTRYTAVNGTTSIATALENTNGVLIRLATSYVTGSTHSSFLSIDGFFHVLSLSSTGVIKYENIFVPPGIAVGLNSSGTTHQAVAWAEVL